MKTLQKYILETKHINGDNEETDTPEGMEAEGMRALKTFDEAKKYLEKYGGISKDGPMTEELLKEIYSKYKEGMPAPIVADRGDKKGKFVLRRWVGKDPDLVKSFEKAGFDPTKKNKNGYQGLHDTSLREDGVFIPTASQMEYLLAVSINRSSGFYTDGQLEKNLIFAMTGEEEKGKKFNEKLYKNLLKYYKANQEHLNKLGESMSKIGSPVYKAPISDDVTDYWKKNGKFVDDEGNRLAKPNKTPKTDLISKDKTIRISAKKVGGAQLMSGAYNETLATIQSQIHHIKDKKAREELEELLEKWAYHKSKGENDEQRHAESKENNKELTTMLGKLFNRYPKFEKGVIEEATTGALKYGKDSQNVPNYVLTFDADTGDAVMDDVESYIKHAVKNSKTYASHKSSNDTTNNVLRIEVTSKVGEHGLEDPDDYDEDETGKDGEEQEIIDDDGKKIKVIIHTGTRGGRFYISDEGNRVYVT